jgi:hypothetical protein
VIRRTFWLAAGATAGIIGYRRAVSAGRAVSARLESGPHTRRVKRGLIRGTIKFGRDAHGFTRDVREGMDLYIARHPGPQRPTLPASTRIDVKDDR